MKNPKEIRVKFYSDPGHGWFAVKRKYIKLCNAAGRGISHFSYQRGATVYLEEDCDFNIFEVAAKLAGFTVKIESCKVLNKAHPIRSYDAYVEDKEGDLG